MMVLLRIVSFLTGKNVATIWTYFELSPSPLPRNMSQNLKERNHICWISTMSEQSSTIWSSEVEKDAVTLKRRFKALQKLQYLRFGRCSKLFWSPFHFSQTLKTCHRAIVYTYVKISWREYLARDFYPTFMPKCGDGNTKLSEFEL